MIIIILSLCDESSVCVVSFDWLVCQTTCSITEGFYLVDPSSHLWALPPRTSPNQRQTGQGACSACAIYKYASDFIITDTNYTVVVYTVPMQEGAARWTPWQMWEERGKGSFFFLRFDCILGLISRHDTLTINPKFNAELASVQKFHSYSSMC